MLYGGINSGIQQTAKQPTAWMALLSSVNPVILTIGIAGLAAYALFNGAKSGKKPENQPLPNGSIAAKSTVQPLTKPLINSASTVKKINLPSKENAPSTAKPTVDPLKEEVAEKEMLRKVMSNLGKKSAAARTRKRAEQREES